MQTPRAPTPLHNPVVVHHVLNVLRAPLFFAPRTFGFRFYGGRVAFEHLFYMRGEVRRILFAGIAHGLRCVGVYVS